MRRLTNPKNLIILSIIVILSAIIIYLMIDVNGLKQKNRELWDKQEQERVAVFFIKVYPSNSCLKPLLVKVPGKKEKHVEALEALFAGPPEALVGEQKLLNIFPEGTSVLNFTLNDGVATVNLNQRIKQMNVGSQGEALAVAAIVNTLTKFPDVYQVKILIEGKEVESLAGHIDLTNVIRYNDQAVDPVPIVQ